MILQEKELKSKLTSKFYKILVSSGVLTNLSDDKASKIMLELSHMKIPMVTQILAVFLGQLGIHIWIWIAGLIDANILSKK